jgi:hypothetical protein
MELILDVFSNDAYASCPEAVRIELDEADLERIEAMHRVAVEHDLLHVAVRCYQPEYGYRGEDGEFVSVEDRQRQAQHAEGWRMECEVMVVTGDGEVRWEAYCKYAGTRFASESLGIATLRRAPTGRAAEVVEHAKGERLS